MLAWDKPLKEQPATVQKALKKLGVTQPSPADRGAIEAAKEAFRANPSRENRQAMDALMGQGRNIMGSDIIKRGLATEEALQQAGIPGIRYLDAGSRTRTDGETVGVFQDPSGQWRSKIRKTPSGQIGDVIPMAPAVTTSMPFNSEAAARKWAEDSIGSGTSNMVVFSPEMMRILERNGEATGARPWAAGEWGGAATDQGGFASPQLLGGMGLGGAGMAAYGLQDDQEGIFSRLGQYLRQRGME